MFGLLEKSVNILVVVASWNDMSDLLKFWCQSHRGAGLQVSRSMLVSCSTAACPPISSMVVNAECLMNVRWFW